MYSQNRVTNTFGFQTTWKANRAHRIYTHKLREIARKSHSPLLLMLETLLNNKWSCEMLYSWAAVGLAWPYYCGRKEGSILGDHTASSVLTEVRLVPQLCDGMLKEKPQLAPWQWTLSLKIRTTPIKYTGEKWPFKDAEGGDIVESLWYWYFKNKVSFCWTWVWF